jgi:hypothetical protein
LTLIAPIRPLQLSADGGYQLRLGVLGVPLIMVPDRTRKGDTPKGILLCEGSGPRALLLIRGSKAGPSEGFDSRLRALGLRAFLLIRGSKAGPSEGFDSRLRALGLRAHHWSEVRRLAPRRGSTAASSHSGSAPTTDQGFEGWPLGRVRQPPQATRAPRPLLIRGS